MDQLCKYLICFDILSEFPFKNQDFRKLFYTFPARISKQRQDSSLPPNENHLCKESQVSNFSEKYMY